MNRKGSCGKPYSLDRSHGKVSLKWYIGPGRYFIMDISPRKSNLGFSLIYYFGQGEWFTIFEFMWQVYEGLMSNIRMQGKVCAAGELGVPYRSWSKRVTVFGKPLYWSYCDPLFQSMDR